MNHRSRNHTRRLALPALITALAALSGPSAAVDISNTPLASASNLAVKPNLMFILDDSGSMNFDALPDNAEPEQGASERTPSRKRRPPPRRRKSAKAHS